MFSPISGELNTPHKIFIKRWKMWCEIIHVKHKNNLAGITTKLLKLHPYESAAVRTFIPKDPVILPLVCSVIFSH